MARTREFNPSEALDQAMVLFWTHGYGDTSMDQIVETTGVSRYGLYNTFGNKRELFIKALKRYGERMVHEIFTGLAAPDACFDIIKKGLTERLGRLRANSEVRRGCMLCNTATEVAPHDDFVAAALREMYDDMAKLFQRALANSKDKGELRADLDVKAAAFYLVGVLQGLAVMARAGVDRKRTRQFVNTALQTLE